MVELDVEPGIVIAKVQGSRYTPYRVRIQCKALSDQQWRRLEKAMASQALPLAQLLAGGLEVGDTILELLQRQHIGIDLVVALQLGEKAPQRCAIGPKVERQDVRVCEP